MVWDTIADLEGLCSISVENAVCLILWLCDHYQSKAVPSITNFGVQPPFTPPTDELVELIGWYHAHLLMAAVHIHPTDPLIYYIFWWMQAIHEEQEDIQKLYTGNGLPPPTTIVSMDGSTSTHSTSGHGIVVSNVGALFQNHNGSVGKALVFTFDANLPVEIQKLIHRFELGSSNPTSGLLKTTFAVGWPMRCNAHHVPGMPSVNVSACKCFAECFLEMLRKSLHCSGLIGSLLQSQLAGGLSPRSLVKGTPMSNAISQMSDLMKIGGRSWKMVWRPLGTMPLKENASVDLETMSVKVHQLLLQLLLFLLF